MRETLVVITGLISGAVAWLPFMVGLAAHRYTLGSAQTRSINRLVQLGTRAPDSFSVLGRLGFVLVMLVWTGIFFVAMLAPALVAKLLEVPEASPAIGYAMGANMFVAVFAFFAGPVIWRRLAL